MSAGLCGWERRPVFEPRSLAVSDLSSAPGTSALDPASTSQDVSVTLFDPPPRSRVWRDGLGLWFQFGSLALTAWVLWGARLAPRWAEIPVGTLIFRSAIYALAAWIAGAAITLVLYLGIMQWEREDAIRATLRTSSAAVWFAPSVILLTALSPAAVAAAAVLVISATRALYHEWRLQHPPVVSVPAPPAGLFASTQLPVPHFWRDAAPGLAISFCLQTGAAGLLLRKPLLAGVGFAMGVSIATLFALTSRAAPSRPPQSLPRAVLGVLLTIVLAIGLTVAGMVPLWMRGDGSGAGFGTGSGKTASRGNAPQHPNPPSPDRLPRGYDASLADGGFPGVILWPEIKPYATLIAPMPQRADGLATAERRPMSIPFSGEYWMYRWPYARPPHNSFLERGSPDALSFRSTDRRPIEMEARHKLDQPIALNCCSRIDLAIRNADRFPHTISLELVLIDNEQPGEPFVSLGNRMVVSQPDLNRAPVAPAAETLEFNVPDTSPIEAFNEFKIVFYRDGRRADQSAKVAIDRFILIPR